MAEQEPEKQPDESDAPGEIERAQPVEPLDPEQLRQFQQFQQFQDYLRFTEAQRQNGGLVPSQGAPPVPPPTGPPLAPPPGLPSPRRKITAPRWAKRLAGKLLSALLLLIVLAIAGKLVYNYFFPSQDDNRPASETGGGTYHANKILSTQPYEAVRTVYDAIAQRDPNPEDMVARACGRFREDVQQKFAADTGYPDCRQSVLSLHTQVSDVNGYAESIPSYVSGQTGDTVTIDSCSFPISGGPALGVFVVSKVDKGQWLITGHERGPTTCPVPSTPPTTS
ncbi:hypothetical protein [Amycolatopsis pigmentata]|uniref:Mce-associated membrane protein n=1 Tax=Amycolatopsis pigmentata TaxID=450801 RepID=A0ABW5G4L4_9PSEU